jgi:hypothetical protein
MRHITVVQQLLLLQQYYCTYVKSMNLITTENSPIDRMLPMSTNIVIDTNHANCIRITQTVTTSNP